MWMLGVWRLIWMYISVNINCTAEFDINPWQIEPLLGTKRWTLWFRFCTHVTLKAKHTAWIEMWSFLIKIEMTLRLWLSSGSINSPPICLHFMCVTKTFTPSLHIRRTSQKTPRRIRPHGRGNTVRDDDRRGDNDLRWSKHSGRL